MIILSPAKINLYLEVLGTLPDGYHELVTLLARLSLADVIGLEFQAGDTRRRDRVRPDRRGTDRRGNERREADRRSNEEERRVADRRQGERRESDRRSDDRRISDRRSDGNRRSGLDRRHEQSLRDKAEGKESIPHPERRGGDRRGGDRREAGRREGERRQEDRRTGEDRRKGERRAPTEDGDPGRRKYDRRFDMDRRLDPRRAGGDRRYPPEEAAKPTQDAPPEDKLQVELGPPPGPPRGAPAGAGMPWPVEREALTELAGSDNLCLRAIKLYRDATGFPKGPVRVKLTKKIPVAAGLGGGSSNCASVLKALNELAPDPLPLKRLMEMGTELGADVPFFLSDEAISVAKGRGERLFQHRGEPVPPYVLLANSGERLKTKDVFQRYELTKGAPGTNLKPTPGKGMPLGHNSLYPAAMELSATLAQALADVGKAATGAPHGMSGSGPTLWALFGTLAQAQKAEAKLAKSGKYWTGVFSIV
ncbi:MAG: hypothetical protein LBF40_03175 [Deltaproteobacteria bacterium]|jgi:4-diphosphocytidyl-2-C-methyl-D-erythritol kinase|nr:hypothetical protein [Deltaproteobacteria bacterium]